MSKSLDNVDAYLRKNGTGRVAGFRPRTTRLQIDASRRAQLFDSSRRASPLCCGGKRAQNHFHPATALRVPNVMKEYSGAAELASLRQSSLSFRIFLHSSAVSEGEKTKWNG